MKKRYILMILAVLIVGAAIWKIAYARHKDTNEKNDPMAELVEKMGPCSVVVHPGECAVLRYANGYVFIKGKVIKSADDLVVYYEAYWSPTGRLKKNAVPFSKGTARFPGRVILNGVYVDITWAREDGRFSVILPDKRRKDVGLAVCSIKRAENEGVQNLKFRYPEEPTMEDYKKALKPFVEQLWRTYGR